MSDPEAGDGDDEDGGFVFGGDATGTDTETPAEGETVDPAPGDARGGPARGDGAGDPAPETAREWLDWFLHTDHGAVVYVREVASSIGVVLLIGLLLFAVSGLWPPMVAVESSSMYPHMKTGDLVFVMEEHRLAPDAAHAETGVVTYRTGQRAGYTKFQLPGDVIVYRPNGDAAVTPIIHRARFWVNESENWYRKGDREAMGGANGCVQLEQCPAPNSGFITKGDNNVRYDQVSGLSKPVKPEWVVGTAEFRVPWLGNIRLWAGQSTVVTAGSASPSPVPRADTTPSTSAEAGGNATTACAWG